MAAFDSDAFSTDAFSSDAFDFGDLGGGGDEDDVRTLTELRSLTGLGIRALVIAFLLISL